MQYLIDGPEQAFATFAFAHGAGKGMDAPFMEKFAQGLADKGIKVVRFNFPYMARRAETGKKSPPDRAPKLLACWRSVIDDLGGPDNLFIGGKSMGGRMATMVASDLETEGRPLKGVCVTGYPFHAPGKLEPEARRTEHLMAGYQTPTLICQGARDTFGWWDEVVTYGLPETIDFCWLDDGDHDFKPRVLSGKTMRENHDTAIAAIADWIKARA